MCVADYTCTYVFKPGMHDVMQTECKLNVDFHYRIILLNIHVYIATYTRGPFNLACIPECELPLLTGRLNVRTHTHTHTQSHTHSHTHTHTHTHSHYSNLLLITRAGITGI